MTSYSLISDKCQCNIYFLSKIIFFSLKSKDSLESNNSKLKLLPHSRCVSFVFIFLCFPCQFAPVHKSLLIKWVSSSPWLMTIYHLLCVALLFIVSEAQLTVHESSRWLFLCCWAFSFQVVMNNAIIHTRFKRISTVDFLN